MQRGTQEAALALLISAAVMLLAGLVDLRREEGACIDLRFRLRGPIPAGDKVAILLVDDASLAALGRWPISRHLYARAVRDLSRIGARVVAFDVLFPEAEEPIPPETRAAIAAAIGSSATPEDAARLKRLADDDPDADFTSAIKDAGNVVLPFALSFSGAKGTAPDDMLPAAYQKFGKAESASLDEALSVIAPIAPLAKAAAGLGHVDISVVDSVPRYDHAAFAFDGDYYPLMAISIAATYLKIPWPDVSLGIGHEVTLGALRIPTDPDMRFLVNYRGPRGSFPTYSFIDFLQGHVPGAALANRIVLIAGSFSGNQDTVLSPFDSKQISGSERLASSLMTILDGDFITQPSVGRLFLVRMCVVLLAALSGLILARAPTWLAALGIALAPAAWIGAAQISFDHGVLIPLAAPTMALALAGAGVLLFRYWVTDRQGRIVRRQFGHYLAPEMVELLASNPQRLQLGGETREMTLLFCDIRGFTGIAERYRNAPQDLTRLINRF